MHFGGLAKVVEVVSNIQREDNTVDSITSIGEKLEKRSERKKTGRDRDEDRESMQLAMSKVIRTFPRDDVAWLSSLAEQKIRAMHV